MENLEKLVQSLNLPFEGQLREDTYILQLNNSDDFSVVYNLISTNKQLNLDDSSVSTETEARFIFYNDDFELKLEADFNDDVYQLNISRR